MQPKMSHLLCQILDCHFNMKKEYYFIFRDNKNRNIFSPLYKIFYEASSVDLFLFSSLPFCLLLSFWWCSICIDVINLLLGSIILNWIKNVVYCMLRHLIINIIGCVTHIICNFIISNTRLFLGYFTCWKITGILLC